MSAAPDRSFTARVKKAKLEAKRHVKHQTIKKPLLKARDELRVAVAKGEQGANAYNHAKVMRKEAKRQASVTGAHPAIQKARERQRARANWHFAKTSVTMGLHDANVLAANARDRREQRLYDQRKHATEQAEGRAMAHQHTRPIASKR